MGMLRRRMLTQAWGQNLRNCLTVTQRHVELDRGRMWHIDRAVWKKRQRNGGDRVDGSTKKRMEIKANGGRHR